MPNYNYLWLPPSIPTYFFGCEGLSFTTKLDVSSSLFLKEKKEGAQMDGCYACIIWQV